eukprot:CAMPEP_0194063180 /NCGR_PEP_ID=MMETSP0009_2-20130614/79677_1 /TAXON_ID=210454 /ORGANISM="Grammatophora oceanica, Strain CCMP 410" /LENGTH=140 /DNA_ID=CAMNT_0038715209 /DNA_START=100 /DNA_END=518 /DNA_ORIENTATION=+
MATAWASVANTVPTGFWASFHLTRDKAALSEVRKELDGLLLPVDSNAGESIPAMIFSLDELESMQCLDSVIQETSRMYSESITARDVVDVFVFEMKLGSDEKKRFWLEKGSRVVLLSSLLHYNKDVFEDPTSFCWNRFLP